MDSQHYSKIALKYLQDLSQKNGLEYTMICYGDIGNMEELFVLFGGNRNKQASKANSWNGYIYNKFKFVMDKLDRESKKPDAIFEKYYISYPGIIKRPTRCFQIKEK